MSTVTLQSLCWFGHLSTFKQQTVAIWDSLLISQSCFWFLRVVFDPVRTLVVTWYVPNVISDFWLLFRLWLNVACKVSARTSLLLCFSFYACIWLCFWLNPTECSEWFHLNVDSGRKCCFLFLASVGCCSSGRWPAGATRALLGRRSATHAGSATPSATHAA